MDINYQLWKLKQGVQHKALDIVLDDEEFSKTERFGHLAAHYFRFNGRSIMEAFESALEDANCHDEAEAVRSLRQQSFGD